jgi:catechol 2,3-dioxygenase-like lactoylglutathione lyase family enzyme
MRLQLALNVSDLDESIAFYQRMFGVAPAKIKPGYANFAIENPPLKLILFEGEGLAGSINHLGVETETAAEVSFAEARLSSEGLAPTATAETICCFAEKTETWVEGPDGQKWEWYVKTGDTDRRDNLVLREVVVPREVGAAAGAGDANACCS